MIAGISTVLSVGGIPIWFITDVTVPLNDDVILLKAVFWSDVYFLLVSFRSLISVFDRR